MVMMQLSAETGPVLTSMNPSPRFKNTGPCFWCIDGAKCLNDTVFPHQSKLHHVLLRKKLPVVFVTTPNVLKGWRAQNSAWCSSKEAAATLLCEEQKPPHLPPYPNPGQHIQSYMSITSNASLWWPKPLLLLHWFFPEKKRGWSGCQKLSFYFWVTLFFPLKCYVYWHMWNNPEKKMQNTSFYLLRNIQFILINYVANTMRQSPFEFLLSLNCTALIYCL